jgi:CAAX prenyl protease-like protein
MPAPIDLTESPELSPLSRLRARLSDDLAYILPILVFLLFNWIGTRRPDLPFVYPLAYAVKAVLVTALLLWLWPIFTRIRWDYWWLGLLLGIVGIVQWIGMQLWIQNIMPKLPSPFDVHPPPADQLFDPFAKIQPAWLAWAWVALRSSSAVLLVPVMEELFWRDYLWRRIVAPNDFRLSSIGEWDPKAFVLIPLVFATVHGHWWLTAIVWAFMIGGLLAWTKSLGACIVMHATTNLLLQFYVLWTRDWSFW